MKKRLSLLSASLAFILLHGITYGKVIMPKLKSTQPDSYTKMPYISSRDMENAFAKAEAQANQRQTTEKSLAKNGGIISKSSFSAEARHQRFTAIDPLSVKMDENQQLFEGASMALADQYKLSREQKVNGLPRVDLPHGSNKASRAVSGCQKMFSAAGCDSELPFRTADGSCNNLNNPLWGKSFTCFERLLPPDYADGLGAPRVAASGNPLPNPRLISSVIHTDINIPAREYTLMTMQWGQFMDHDMTLTPMTRAGASMDMIECCPFNDGQPKHPACMPIPIPSNDKFYAPRGQSCLNFVRSAACDSSCNLGPRQQTNQLTAFIDASNVYGSDDNETRSLRSFRNGMLKAQTSSTAGELLPPSIDPENDQCSRQEGLQDCFHAGDERVNEQPGLTSMHTVWLRQHNRLAGALKDLDPRARDEELFQRARKIVGAQLQAVTYGEFLPVVLGPDYLNYFKLALGEGSTTYDPNTQPTIVHEFSTAAYRFGHTLIQNLFPEVNARGAETGSLNLSENFFFPFALFRGELPSIVRGLTVSPAQDFDRHIVESVTNNLYKQRGTAFGMDLPALNLQRARDHGLNGYTAYINFCFQDQIKDFSDLGKYMIEENWRKLSDVYESVQDVELFTGGVSETPLDGAVVGPTFGCIIGLQFFHLKYGDRFYFEHEGVFSTDQLNQIRNTKLARVLCYNAGISKIKQNVFRPKSPAVDCNRLYEIDLDYFSPGNDNYQ